MQVKQSGGQSASGQINHTTDITDPGGTCGEPPSESSYGVHGRRLDVTSRHVKGPRVFYDIIFPSFSPMDNNGCRFCKISVISVLLLTHTL